ncbi:MAG TPA: hypothetical protein VMP11_04900 [Verrucomicrobiae bacterium]|nr:hypothetical protein [Verrucomicrobiae bacterium]
MDRLADRENLPVEIAILVSLLLHAMAFGTWQYRALLGKLPLLSSLTRLVQVVHVQPKAAAPPMQTITFVKLDEPTPPPPPEKAKETRTFIETDASQDTGEKPKTAQFYSDKSTVAANEKNPTGKLANTPYLEGKENHALNTLDVPTPSGVAAPIIMKPTAPTPPAAVARPPSPAPAKTAQAATEQKPAAAAKAQTQSPAQAAEIPAQGLKIVEDEKVAQAPKMAGGPDVATGSEVPVPPAEAEMAGGGAPAMASEPGVPGRELVSRKAHLVAAGVSRAGVAAFNVEESPFGAYDKKVVKAIQSRWYQLIDRYGIYESTATVTVYFELFDDGQVKNVKTTDGSENSILSLFCEKAILESGPFDPWPESLRALVGKEPREASITFYY